ncbi:MAG: 2-phospho-L-lactate guanylyltransferase [Sporichthyaceae bacterium]|nr:2-phospho-L-lactate guanylyltransferase [Sporichthyaceae bacterium]
MSREAQCWVLVVPVKRLDLAKTRLGPPYDTVRAQLALAFALDTTAAALATSGVSEVVAVTDDSQAAARLRELGAYVVPDEPDSGLNPALVHGARVAASRHPGCGSGALSGDLPSLDPVELAHALSRAATHETSFVRDAEGSGTTLVLATPGSALKPAFGAASADRHTSAGHVEIGGRDLQTVRQDVDTAADLQAAVRLGVGPRTAALLSRLGIDEELG